MSREESIFVCFSFSSFSRGGGREQFNIQHIPFNPVHSPRFQILARSSPFAPAPSRSKHAYDLHVKLAIEPETRADPRTSVRYEPSQSGFLGAWYVFTRLGEIVTPPRKSNQGRQVARFDRSLGWLFRFFVSPLVLNFWGRASIRFEEIQN